jgi:hypothetical protein
VADLLLESARGSGFPAAIQFTDSISDRGWKAAPTKQLHIAMIIYSFDNCCDFFMKGN